MQKTDIVGKWSFDAGHKKNLSNDKQLHFNKDASGSVLSASEVMFHFEWAISENSDELLMGNHSSPAGKPMGKRELMACGAALSEEQLPMGKFQVLSFSQFSLPFGLKRFVKVST
ncbi:hypothetical protein [Pleionea sp. CnH1-48]|uniref:hypothetical protein n=1 Tax=Pleionea sp. CnH1-48 TaxID=2954494 RepID=UPI0020978D08|nr:hypothetical protein [Pleionea sp. CnH1-48]MCO7224110.1 hypothetical protein [Pleionea sp. CnH1-48]